MSGLLSTFATVMKSKLTAKWTEIQWEKYGEVTSLLKNTPNKENFSGEEYDQGEYVTDWDVDGFLYNQGIIHSDFGKEVKKELLEIYC